MEDMGEEEYVCTYQLALANGGDANDLLSRDSVDKESAYQLPKKKVNFISLNIYLLSYIYCLSITVYRLAQNQKDTTARWGQS